MISPAQTNVIARTGEPMEDFGTYGNGGARIARTIVPSASGALSIAASNAVSVSREYRNTIAPDRTDPSGTGRNRKRLTTPNPPPLPRNAQKRSAVSSGDTLIALPSAVTTFTASRWSRVRPNRRVSQPIPPPRVRPPIFTSGLSPNGNLLFFFF